MASYEYLIVGAGMTGDAAVRGIRTLDEHESIGLIGSDRNPPYNRPPLTKGLWKGKSLDSIWRQTEQFAVDLYLGRTVRSIDLARKTVTDDQGVEYGYGKLLLATGGTPRRIQGAPPGVIYYRTLEDYRHLRELSGEKDRFGVIGGGFIGSEIAAALSMSGKKVSMFIPEATIGGRIYPPEISAYVSSYFQQKGVELHPGGKVQSIQERDGAYQIITGDGSSTGVDVVVAGLGISPNIELARSAGLAVNNGIVVDELLQTSHPDVFAAGDVAEFNNFALGERMRVEHEDNANTMGTQAGRNMAGAGEPYHHLPFFYSDLFELGYEAVGDLDSRLETFTDWKDPLNKGVVYYLAGGRVRGVLLWNVWDTVPKARQLIALPGPFTASDLAGRL